MNFYTVAMYRNNRMTVHGCFSHEFAAFAKRHRMKMQHPYCDIRVIPPEGSA